MTTTITIKGRTFTVTEIDEAHETEGPMKGRTEYRLLGPRGADYQTFRTVPDPARMFLVGFNGKRGGFNVDPLGHGVWLTDRDGELRLA